MLTDMSRIIKRWLIYALVATLALPSGLFTTMLAAQSAKRKTIAVVGFQPTANVVESDLLEGLNAYLKGRNDLSVVPAESVNSLLTTMELKQDGKARGDLNQGEELFKKGKKAYELLKIDEAVTLFEATLNMFNQSLPYMESNRYLLLTYLYLGMSKISLKRGEEGRSDLRTMLQLDNKRATRSLNAKFFPPDIIATYNKIKKEVTAKANASLSVYCAESGARVLLDGNRLGSVPIQTADLTPGLHRLTVFKRGFERWSEKIDLKEGNNKVEVVLKRWTPFKVIGGDNDTESSTYQQVASSLGADVLILGDVAGSERKTTLTARAQLHAVAAGVSSTIETLTIDEPTVAKQRGFRLAKQLLDHLTAQGVVIPGNAAGGEFQPLQPNLMPSTPSMPPAISQAQQESRPVPFEQPTQPRPLERRGPAFYQKPLFWWIVGGVVVAGLGGTLLFTDIAKTDADNNLLVIDNPGN